MAMAALERRTPPDASQCIAMSARLMPLRSEISFATLELADGLARAKGARSALLGLFEAISAIQAVGLGLWNMSAPSPIVDEAILIARAAIVARHPEKWLAEITRYASSQGRRGPFDRGGLCSGPLQIHDHGIPRRS